MERTVTELYRSHVGFVERVLRRAGVAERDLADASQEVFVVVHRRLGDFEGRASVQTWLYRIAWNVASESRRRAFRRRELLQEKDEAACELAGPDELIETQRSLSALLDAIDRLDAEKREALVCHELDEQPMIAVAKRLGIPLKTAFSRLYAARRALRLELQRQGFACLPWWAWPFARVGPLERLRPSGLMLPARAFLAAAFVGLMPSQPPGLSEVATAVAPPPASAALVQVAPVMLPPAAAVAPAAAASSRVPRRARVRVEQAPPPTAAETAPIAFEDVTVVRTGQLDLGLGPFGESPLAYPALVAPQLHPRAKLVRAAGQPQWPRNADPLVATRVPD